VVDHLLFRFSLCGDISHLFALKVDSCLKSCRIFDFFALPNFVGGTPCKISIHVITPAETHPMVKFREVTNTTSKLIRANMWNFKSNFKCSPLKFLGGTRPGLCVR